MKSYKLVKPYFAEKIQLVILGIACLVSVDLMQLFIPRIIKRAVDDLTAFRADSIQLLKYSAYIIILATGICVLRYTWRRCLIGTSRRVEEGLRNRLFSHVQMLSSTYFDRTKTGDLMAHATNDITNIRMATGMGVVALTDAVFLGTASIAFMAYINIRLTVFAMIPMPFIVFSAKYFSKKMHRKYQSVQAAFGDVTETVRESFSGIRIVKAYNLEEDTKIKLDGISRAYIKRNLSLVRITGSFFPLMILLSNFSFAIIIYFGGREAILGDITTGDFVAFINYLNLITWPMMALGWVTNLLQRGGASLDRIDKILQTRSELIQSEKAVSPKRLIGDICFENVFYSYGKSSLPALSEINFMAERGKTLGIVGPPGSGKTTILNLVPRLYDVGKGRVLIGGTDVRNTQLEDLREKISFVPQEPFLFSGTIRENILVGDPEADEAKLIKAAEMASFNEVIKSLPNGFETIVGEKGVILSGGQKQRLALARALVRESSILLLDDPVSQVDTDTGRAIINTIHALTGIMTLIIVSHRLTALCHADKILVMEDGKIKTLGTHEQLMESDAYYARTFRLQEMEESNNAC